jgi:hypothetical protein
VENHLSYATKPYGVLSSPTARIEYWRG